ncbi:phosphoribosylglycinamide formyltransferase [Ferviditalea candida]|uniref:Phosphoribosylglycinamide formyltransferase n=1 Tax=Ferviditalea candida TaxID=3108399 RepID=A0ABU5ZLJ6_9BACL|nr:phosphoribosylglycinamide formyltransferase [Paenibacillaceae bacterium T2]
MKADGIDEALTAPREEFAAGKKAKEESLAAKESTRPFRIAVFASGTGSNFQAIVDAVREDCLDVRIELLVCDRPQSQVVERASQAGVPAFTFRPKDYDAKEQYESEILSLLKAKEIDLVVLAGYMRMITDILVKPYYGRMINIHPSLLPAFPGVNAIRQALEHGVKITGATVHYVDGGMDSGPIIAQAPVEIRDGDTEETLSIKIHAAEHKLYPKVIRWIREGRVLLEGRNVRVLQD